tara:strand:- start:79 stop:432 length:354 start_codon:yes stop_codon:yes gene_type:complete
MNKLVISILLLLISNLAAWWQLQGQILFKGSKFWDNPYWMSIVGIPIGFLFWWATKLSYEHFGYTWNIRMMGFGVGTIVFGICSFFFLKEIPTLKTAICILLAIAIILIQVTNVVSD